MSWMNATKWRTKKNQQRGFEYTRKNNGSGYKLEDLSNEQQRIVIDVVKTVVICSNNDKDYKPFRATVM